MKTKKYLSCHHLVIFRSTHHPDSPVKRVRSSQTLPMGFVGANPPPFALLASRERLAAGFTCRLVARNPIFWGCFFGWTFYGLGVFDSKKFMDPQQTGGFCIYINFRPFNRIGDFRKQRKTGSRGPWAFSCSRPRRPRPFRPPTSKGGQQQWPHGTGDPGDPGFFRPAKGSGAPSSTTSPTSAPPKASRASIGHQHRLTGETPI